MAEERLWRERRRERLRLGQAWAERAAAAMGLGPKDGLTATNAFTRDAPYTDAKFTVVYERTFDGIPLVDGLVKATFTTEGEVRRTTRTPRIPHDLDTTPKIDAHTAVRAASTNEMTPTDEAPQLVVHTRPTPALAWAVMMTDSPSAHSPLTKRTYVDATTAAVIETVKTYWN